MESPAPQAQPQYNEWNPAPVQQQAPVQQFQQPAPAPQQVFRYDEHIRIVAPAGPPEPSVAPPTTTPIETPKRRSRHTPARANRGPTWLEHVRAWRHSGLSRAAYCDRHDLNPRAFHHWVARARPSLRPKARIQ